MSILVVGALHLDVVLNAPHLPRPDETVTGTSVDYVFGGKGGNQATAAARMGAQVSFAGRAGTDSFGDMIRAQLTQSGIDLDQLQKDSGPSGMSAAIVDAGGDYGAVIVSAANLNIDPSQIVIPQGVRLVLLQNEVPQEVNTRIAQMAKSTGARVWLNAGPVRALPEAFMADLDLMIVNRVEAAAYGKLDVDMLETRGGDGVFFDGAHFPAHSVRVVSTHGAGDMFVGALAARFVDGQSLRDALPFAQAAAALHVSCALQERTNLTAQRVRAFLRTQSNR